MSYILYNFFHESNIIVNRSLAQQNKTFCPYIFRDVWLEALTDTIHNSCRMQRRLCLPIGNEGKFPFITYMSYTYTSECNYASLLDHFSGVEKFSGRGQWISLTILKASSLIWPEERIGYHRRLFCTVMLGRNQHCRTRSVEGKSTASWNFTVSK